MDIVASVANFKALILQIIGSRTPASRLFLTVPLSRSKPVYFRFLYLSSIFSYAVVWRTNNFANKSVASNAAFKANYFGIICKASANSAITVKSFDADLCVI